MRGSVRCREPPILVPSSPRRPRGIGGRHSPLAVVRDQSTTKETQSLTILFSSAKLHVNARVLSLLLSAHSLARAVSAAFRTTASWAPSGPREARRRRDSHARSSSSACGSHPPLLTCTLLPSPLLLARMRRGASTYAAAGVMILCASIESTASLSATLYSVSLRPRPASVRVSILRAFCATPDAMSMLFIGATGSCG